MAEKKNAAQAAAKAPKTNKEQENKEAKGIIDALNATKSNTLSPDSKVMLAYLTQKRWVENPNASTTMVEAGNIIADALMADAIVTNVIDGNGVFAMIIRKDEQKYLAIASMLATQGITVPAFNALPAPTEDQLAKAGVKLLPSETAIVTVKPEDVSKEAIEKKKAEKAIEAKKPATDPTKIENDQQLRESLSAFLTSGKDAPDARIQNAIVFYHSYLELQAQKAENKEEELKKIAELSRPVMLKKIADIVGDCPFAFMGIGNMLAKAAAETGSPIAPYRLYRGGSKGTSNQMVADMVKAILYWTCATRTNSAQRSIARAEANIKNKKGKKEIEQAAINNANEAIKEAEKVLNIVNNPSFDIVDKLIDNYKIEDENSNEYKISHRLVKNVKDLYYKNIDESKIDADVLLKNCQQYAGVITNLFADPLSPSIAYSEANIVEMKEAEVDSEKLGGKGEEGDQGN